MFGGAIGDGLGSAYEGKKQPVELDDAVIWCLTDDTQLTVATCEAIVMSGKVEPERIAEHFARWFKRKKLTGLGGATTKALSELVQGGHWALVGRKGEMAAGNGAAMRVAPLGFLLDVTSERDRVTVRDVCRITHHNDEAYAGALAVVSAVSLAVYGAWEGTTPLLERVAKQIPDTRVREQIETIGRAPADTEISSIAKQYGCSGYVVESVPLALFAAQSIKRGFRTMVTDVVRCGGDSDTNASIAGQIAGAVLGFEGLPSRFVARVQMQGKLEAAASGITKVAEKKNECCGGVSQRNDGNAVDE